MNSTLSEPNLVINHIHLFPAASKINPHQLCDLKLHRFRDGAITMSGPEFDLCKLHKWRSDHPSDSELGDSKVPKLPGHLVDLQ